MKRQKVRKLALVAMFVLFPVTIYYFSPVLVLQAAASGVVNGSLIVFGVQFLVSLFVGRLFCGWACPAGGAQELVALARGRRVNRRRIGWIKYLVWVPWLALLVFFVVQAGGLRRVDFFYQTNHGVSVTDLPSLIVWVIVVVVFAGLAFAIGRRAGCHTICWMAPFMVIGRSVRNRFGWPALRLSSRAEGCESCGTCGSQCPMSIDVMENVRQGRMESLDCILCGSCVDSCPRKVIRYSFRSGGD
jgi:ferredoxin-type protein NapH